MCSFLLGYLFCATFTLCCLYLHLLLLFFLLSDYFLDIGDKLCVHNFIKCKSVKANIEIKVWKFAFVCHLQFDLLSCCVVVSVGPKLCLHYSNSSHKLSRLYVAHLESFSFLTKLLDLFWRLLCLKLNMSMFMILRHTCIMFADVQHPRKVGSVFKDNQVISVWNWRH